MMPEFPSPKSQTTIPHAASQPDKKVPETLINSPTFQSGTWKVTFVKHELDGASRDRRCAKFDEDFGITLYLTELKGEVGCGDSAGDSGFAAKSVDMSIKGKRSKQNTPLYREKEAYLADCEKRALKGTTRITFEQWLLMEKEGDTSKLRLKKVRSKSGEN